MEYIENEILKVGFNLKGGIISSIIDKRTNEELEYQIDPKVWGSQDVVMFPLVGNNNFYYKDKNYKIETRHGILRNKEFSLFSKEKDTISLIYRSSEEDLNHYPFKFESIVTYKLDKETLKVTNKIINKGDEVLYGCGGFHLGVKASSEKGEVVLKDKQTIFKLNKDGLASLKGEDYPNIISLNKKTFKELDTLVFLNKEGGLKLITGFGHTLVYKFNANCFAIWSNKDVGDYVCIEPWWGITNYENESKELEKRMYISSIKDEKEFSYEVSFLLD